MELLDAHREGVNPLLILMAEHGGDVVFHPRILKAYSERRPDDVQEEVDDALFSVLQDPKLTLETRLEYGEMLLKYGASPNVFAGKPFEAWAVCLNTPPILNLMTRYGMNSDHIDAKGCTCLHYMAKTAWSPLLPKLAMMVGINPNIQDNRGWTALHHALWKGNWEMVELLLPVTNVSLKTKREETLLHILVKEQLERKSSIKALVGLIEAGVDLDARTKKSYTALGLAAKNGDLEFMKILLKAGCSVNSKNHQDRTVLHLVIRHRKRYDDEKDLESVCKFLITEGADVDATCSEGCTPLMELMYSPDLTIVRQLLQANCNGRVKMKDDDEDKIAGFMQTTILNNATECARFMFQDSVSSKEDQDMQQTFVDLSQKPKAMVNREDFGNTETIGLYGLLGEHELLEMASIEISPAPISLYSLCRLALRASLPKGPTFLGAVDVLPLPRHVKHFVALR